MSPASTCPAWDTRSTGSRKPPAAISLPFLNRCKPQHCSGSTKGSSMKLAQGTTVITNGQLIDGTGRPAVPNGSVVVQEGRITYAGPASEAPATPPDATTLDAQGGSILPGLVEAHYHPTYFNVAA